MHGLWATFLATVTARSTRGYGKRGRPSQAAPRARIVYTIEGALASSLATRQALIDQHRCFILATNELDEAMLSAQEGAPWIQRTGPGRTWVSLPESSPVLASSFSLKKPARIMALLMVMPVCLFVYPALESRMRTALKDQGATFPDKQGKPTQTPTARWVFHR